MRPASDYKSPAGGIWKLESVSCPSGKPTDLLLHANEQLRNGSQVSIVQIYDNTATEEHSAYYKKNGAPITCKKLITSTWDIGSNSVTVSNTVRRMISTGDPACSGETKELEKRTHAFELKGNRMTITLKPRESDKIEASKVCEDDVNQMHYVRIK